MTLAKMFIELRQGMEWRQCQIAAALDCSAQFICDVEKGRRTPSVAFINRLCTWIGCGPQGRRAWHVAAARAHGWEV
jgi:transcriptional regulator with XRE-family HTH domain